MGAFKGDAVTEARRTEPKRCAGVRKDGSPCGATVMGTGDFCYAHDVTRTTERDQARRKGGANSATRARLDRLVPATLRDMIADLLEAMSDVRAGTLDPRQASALAALGGVVTRAYSVGVLESRIEALEHQQREGVVTV